MVVGNGVISEEATGVVLADWGWLEGPSRSLFELRVEAFCFLEGGGCGDSSRSMMVASKKLWLEPDDGCSTG